MDIARIERRVKKIETVLEAFKEDNKISSIEKDLLLGYVRELYELIKDSEPDSFELIRSTEPARVTPATPAAAAPPPKQESQHIPESPKEPIVEVIREVPVQAPPRQEYVEEKPVVQHTPQKPVENTAAVHHFSEELESIFRMEEVSDLSGKLSMSKIDDIGKALGINERIFTITELFGGNNQLFNNTLEKLNHCQSFAEAKAVLIQEVAIPMKWDKEDKLRKAQQFVKQVRRKFNA